MTLKLENSVPLRILSELIATSPNPIPVVVETTREDRGGHVYTGGAVAIDAGMTLVLTQVTVERYRAGTVELIDALKSGDVLIRGPLIRYIKLPASAADVYASIASSALNAYKARKKQHAQEKKAKKEEVMKKAKSIEAKAATAAQRKQKRMASLFSSEPLTESNNDADAKRRKR